jgi:hypothetical protein
VVQYGDQADTIAASISTDERFLSQFTRVELTVSVRHALDTDYDAMVTEIGDGVAATDADGMVSLHGVQATSDISTATEAIFPTDLTNSNPDECLSRAVLCTTNAAVQEVNTSVIARLNSELWELQASDTLADGDPSTLDYSPDLIDFLSTLEGEGPPYRLNLKVGSVAMLTRTLSFSDRLTNGTKVVVKGISRYRLTVQTADGAQHFIPRVPHLFFSAGVHVRRLQFPLRPCYAITVHRAQGSTLSKAVLDLRTPVFAHGHLYVGLSRVRTSRDIVVVGPAEHIQDGCLRTRNVVYAELLQ